MRTFGLSAARKTESTFDIRAICALATPFLRGEVDVESYVKLCRFQQAQGTDALLALGTTAEAQLLTPNERELLVRLARENTTLPLVVGIEEPSTAEAVKQAKLYATLGADALLIAPPSFCKCTREGYVQHVEAIAQTSNLPIALYNIPSRAGYYVDLWAVEQLTERGIVRCVKDSCADTTFASILSRHTRVLCGSDELLAEYVGAGAAGVVSVVANVAPNLTKQALNGDDYQRFNALAQLAMQEVNPIAIKYLLYKAGIFADYEVRLPLTRANEKTRKSIDEFWNDNAPL